MTCQVYRSLNTYNNYINISYFGNNTIKINRSIIARAAVLAHAKRSVEEAIASATNN